MHDILPLVPLLEVLVWASSHIHASFFILIHLLRVILSIILIIILLLVVAVIYSSESCSCGFVANYSLHDVVPQLGCLHCWGGVSESSQHPSVILFYSSISHCLMQKKKNTICSVPREFQSLLPTFVLFVILLLIF